MRFVRKVKGALTKTTLETEKRAGNAQTMFGHAGAETDALGSLRRMYMPGCLRERRARLIADNFLAGDAKDVLEIGSGFGDLSIYFSTVEPQHHYVISDLTEKKFKEYFQKVKDFFGVTGAYTCVSFAAESIPFPENSFDRIFIRAAVHHLADTNASFYEMHRILRPGGKLVFFQEPIAFEIPIVSHIQRFFAGSEEKAMGFNEHIYSVGEYMSFGKLFSDRKYHIDPLFLRDLEVHSKNWGPLKRNILRLIEANPFLFRQFLIRQYGIPFYFEFTK